MVHAIHLDKMRGAPRVLLSLDVCEWADPQDERVVRDAAAAEEPETPGGKLAPA